MSTDETANAKQECKHFHGVQRPCAAGVDPMTVRDVSGKGMARWPCLTLIGRPYATTTCAKRELMTAEDEAVREAEHTAAFQKFMADLDEGRCPHCQKPMTKRTRSGRCEYAEPCGHRLGQVGDDDDE